MPRGVRTLGRGLRRNQTCQALDLRLLASKTVRSKCLLFKPPRLQSFTTAALQTIYLRLCEITCDGAESARSGSVPPKCPGMPDA